MHKSAAGDNAYILYGLSSLPIRDNPNVQGYLKYCC